MVDRTAEVRYGDTAAVIETYPPEWADGEPTAPGNVSVYRHSQSNDETPEFTAASSVDATSLVVDEESGRAQAIRNRFKVGATTGLVIDRLYRVTNPDGQRELVTAKRIASADYVDFDADLVHDYPVGSTLKGLRITFTVDATWAATDSKILVPEVPAYRVIWPYTVASLARKHYTYFRLVRQTSRSSVTITDLKGRWPGVQLEFRAQEWEALLAEAEKQVRVDIRAAGFEPSQLRDTEIWGELIKRKAIFLIACQGIAPKKREDTFYFETKQEYDALLNTTLRGALRIPMDQGTEGASSSVMESMVWFER